jgi:hypothetical protein
LFPKWATFNDLDVSAERAIRIIRTVGRDDLAPFDPVGADHLFVVKFELEERCLERVHFVWLTLIVCDVKVATGDEVKPQDGVARVVAREAPLINKSTTKALIAGWIVLETPQMSNDRRYVLRAQWESRRPGHEPLAGSDFVEDARTAPVLE